MLNFDAVLAEENESRWRMGMAPFPAVSDWRDPAVVAAHCNYILFSGDAGDQMVASCSVVLRQVLINPGRFPAVFTEYSVTSVMDE